MIALEEVRTVLRGYIPVRDLCVDRSHASVSFSCLLLGRRTRRDAAMAAVITHAIHRNVVNDGLVDIHIMDHRGIHAVDSGIVVKIVAAPGAAFISIAIVTIAVVHAAIKADVRAPIAGMP